MAIKELSISYDDVPPEYSDSKGSARYQRLTTGLQVYVRLSVDLTQLPPSAWELRWGTGNVQRYRRVYYHLGLHFGPGGIEWRYMHDGKIIGSVDCEYTG